MAASALSVIESAKLENLEEVIAGGMQSFVDVGRALTQIRDERLYRKTHKTFEEYCRERWQMSQPRAYQLIEAADAVEAVSTIVETPPANEAQARPLTRLPTSHQPAAWKEGRSDCLNTEFNQTPLTRRDCERRSVTSDRA